MQSRGTWGVLEGFSEELKSEDENEEPRRGEEEWSKQQVCRYKGPVVSPSGWSTEGTSPVGTVRGGGCFMSWAKGMVLIC